MIIYYNRDGIGDTLVVYLKDSAEMSVERKADIARILDPSTDETLGYNFFNISAFLSLEETGMVKQDQNLINQLNSLLKQAGFAGDLVYDDRSAFITGYVIEKKKHPDADKLSVCQVDIGEETLQIVCGAPNVDEGQKVVVARVGALMPNGTIIRDAELRGLPSHGMICSARELALPGAPQKKGILVLDEGTPIGRNFFAALNK